MISSAVKPSVYVCTLVFFYQVEKVGDVVMGDGNDDVFSSSAQN